jgi:hypothetical protein
MRRVMKIFSITALCGLYSLVFAEGFLRLLAPQAIIPRHVTAAPYGVRMNQPGAEYRHVTPETRVSIRVNEQGFRADTTYTQEKTDGVARIALFGDSYFMGYEVNLEDSFAWQLEQQLRSMRCPVEVINFSVSGFGTAEMLRTLQEKGINFDPDMVIFQWHHTDPADNRRAGLYALQQNRLVPTHANYVPAVGARETLNKIPMYKWVSENSHLYAAVRENTAMFIKALLAGDIFHKKAGTSDITTLEQPEPYRASLLDVALLEEAKRFTQQEDAAFYVVDVPSFHERTSFSSGFRLLPQELVQQASYISPIEDFRTAANPDTKIYWEKGHFHLTPFGNRLLAETVATRLYARDAQRLLCQ